MKLLVPAMVIGEYVEEKPITITAADRTYKYNNAKIAQDHEAFKKIIGQHYKVTNKAGRTMPAKFNWKKIFTRKYAVHHFSHPHKKAPEIIIKRKHIDGQPHYRVKIKMPHPTKEGRFIYHRTSLTKNPTKTLHRMLNEARWSQHTGKQFHSNQHEAEPISPMKYKK